MTPLSCARSALLVGPVLTVVGLVPVGAQTAGPRLGRPEVLACAPRLVSNEATSNGRIVVALDTPLRRLFRVGDVVELSLGRADGVSVGAQYFTRRATTPADRAMRTRGIRVLQTSGWLRAVVVDEHSTRAVVEGLCSDMRSDDLLVPLQWPAAVSVATAGTAGYDDPATVLFGRDGRATLTAGQFLVIDQGADRQIVPGQHLTLFRAAPAGSQAPVTHLGEAVAVLVESVSATLEVIRADGAIRSGDLAAVQR